MEVVKDQRFMKVFIQRIIYYLIAAKCTEGRGRAAKQCGEITGEKDEKAGCLADLCNGHLSAYPA
jgi:hypothetical protein